ncbi:hypothetical protein [uncultured Sphingomonas sp.]|uniref:hypothetical protein n=1 Tax=uncultured Sphingomonas sp. TaxID=158754 RepID=UPI0025CF350F|nr:hypothetical protein [uncultured Sphingomonas sp.]
MVVRRTGTDVTRYLIPAALLAAGVIIAASIAAMPRVNFDLLLWRLGLPDVIPAAAPPVGATGRTLLALAALFPFLLVSAIAWRLGNGGPLFALRRRDRDAGLPALRRADAHPDHPPRWPIRADEDLGPPLPAVGSPAARVLPGDDLPLPADLDQPLAAFDPIAIPDVPREPALPVAPLVTIVVPPRSHDAAPETSESLPHMPAEIADDLSQPPISDDDAAPEEPVPELVPTAEVSPAEWEAPTPAAEEPDAAAPEPLPLSELAAEPAADQSDADQRDEPASPEPHLEPAPEPANTDQDSISALLDRLERGAQRRKGAPPPAPPLPEPDPPAPSPPPGSLDDTLVMLRRMARG